MTNKQKHYSIVKSTIYVHALMKYDVIIVGSGLGGLQCAYIMSREGFKVCLIEKNSQLGGCLQTFKRKGSVFDTGMHYIGSVEEGQFLYRFLKYFRLDGRLKIRKMNEEAYEIIRLGDREFSFANGYDHFSEKLLSYFPGESAAISTYIARMQEVKRSVDLLNMDTLPGQKPGYFNYFSIGFNDYLDSLTGNRELKNLLIGNSPLYAGVKDRTPLYIPMIINSTYVDSAYRFVDGGSQFSDLLAGSIVENGGTIIRNAEVTKFVFSSGSMKSVVINDSEEITAKWFISNIHPKAMLSLFENAPVRPAYQKRISGSEDTYGMFSLYLAMKENTYEYINSHYYIYRTDDVWHGDRIVPGRWPESYMMHFSPGSKNEKYTSSIIVTAYMNWSEVAPWENTFTGRRGDDYNDFKADRAEKLLDVAGNDFPGLRSRIKSYYTSTPLTYRDYTGTYRGSVYGLLKDFNSPLKTLIMPKTKVPNLFLTGQNINVHGVVGVTIGSVLTCGEILGTQYVLEKVRHA